MYVHRPCVAACGPASKPGSLLLAVWLHGRCSGGKKRNQVDCAVRWLYSPGTQHTTLSAVCRQLPQCAHCKQHASCYQSHPSHPTGKGQLQPPSRCTASVHVRSHAPEGWAAGSAAQHVLCSACNRASAATTTAAVHTSILRQEHSRATNVGCAHLPWHMPTAPPHQPAVPPPLPPAAAAAANMQRLRTAHQYQYGSWAGLHSLRARSFTGHGHNPPTPLDISVILLQQVPPQHPACLQLLSLVEQGGAVVGIPCGATATQLLQ